MPTAERSPAAAPAQPSRTERSRRWAWGGLAVVLAAGLGLRLWGIQQGLPYAYDIDELDHFVPHAVSMFEHGLNPHYFANPPAYTYLLHAVFALRYGTGASTRSALVANPTGVYTLARVVAAVLGVLALWLLYATGARLLGRAAGLLAAAIEAVAFLPVFYAHLALNDVPTLAPLTLSLLGSAGVLRKDRARDHVLAGVGLGLACATKYTAGIVLVTYLAAVAARLLGRRPSERPARGERPAGERPAGEHSAGERPAGERPAGEHSAGEHSTGEHPAGEHLVAEPMRARSRHACACVALTALVALAAFLIANPYAILDFSAFRHELAHQSAVSAEPQGKLGAPKEGGLLYYLWTLTWGLGWVPTLAALGGALTVWRRERALGWMLVTPVVLYLAFMGLQGRYFGRWLLPIFPLLCLLAVLFAVELVGALARRAPRLRLAIARDRGRGAAGAGARLQRALRARALAHGHAHPDAPVAGRAHPGRHADRGRAGVPERVGRALDQVSIAAVSHLPGRRARTEPRAHDRDRELRADAQPGTARLLPDARLLLGRDRLDGVRARLRRPPRGAAGDRLLPGARSRRAGRLPRLAVRARARSGAVRLRLELRLLPAGLCAPGTVDDRLSPARWALRSLNRPG